MISSMNILWIENSDELVNLDEKLGHLSENVQCELKQLIHEREDHFPNVPSRIYAADHDVDVGDMNPSNHAHAIHLVKRVLTCM